jgi:hypothetical protein
VNRRLSCWMSLAIATLTLISSTSLGQSSTLTLTSVPSVDQLRQKALDHENARRWNEAVQSWMQILTQDRNQPEARKHLTQCVRQTLRANRQRDVEFQSRLLAMSQADILALYGEVLSKLQAHYPESEKVTSSRLFQQGLEEFRTSLADRAFREAHFKKTEESGLQQFRTSLQKSFGDREIVSHRQAVETVAEIASLAKRKLNGASINAIVSEFICGACHSLDEYSQYLSAKQLLAEDSTPTSIEVRLEENNIAYLKITHFQLTTPQEIESALKGMMGIAKALIIDLRGNSGGVFLSAVKTVEQFLPGGVIVTAQGQHQDFNKVYSSSSGTAASDLPILVLIDGETASAAEVLAAALHDNRRAKLIGTGTFGKGTVQNIIKLTTAEEIDPKTGKTQPRAGVRITVARLLSPNGNPLTGIGVIPDFFEANAERQYDLALEQARELARSYVPGMGFMR